MNSARARMNAVEGHIRCNRVSSHQNQLPQSLTEESQTGVDARTSPTDDYRKPEYEPAQQAAVTSPGSNKPGPLANEQFQPAEERKYRAAHTAVKCSLTVVTSDEDSD